MKRPGLFQILLLTAAATFPPAAAQSFPDSAPCEKVDSWSVTYNFSREEKASAHSNDEADVHHPVMDNVLQQLRAKVGNDFIDNLHFTHVKGVDFDRNSELSLEDLKRIDAYDFTFEVRVGEGGIHRYAFAVGTDKSGKFLRDVEIPHIAATPKKGVIKPCSDAVGVALNAGGLTQTRQIFVRLQFDSDSGVFVWDISAYRKGTGRALTSDHVWLNANDLAVVKKYDQHEAF